MYLQYLKKIQIQDNSFSLVLFTTITFAQNKEVYIIGKCKKLEK